MMVLGAQIRMIRIEEEMKKAELEKDENVENALPVKQGFLNDMLMKMNMKKKPKDSKNAKHINTMFDVSVYET